MVVQLKKEISFVVILMSDFIDRNLFSSLFFSLKWHVKASYIDSLSWKAFLS